MRNYKFVWGLFIAARDGRRAFLQRQPQFPGLDTKNFYLLDLVGSEREVMLLLKPKIVGCRGLALSWPKKIRVPFGFVLPPQLYKEGEMRPQVTQSLPSSRIGKRTHSCPDCHENLIPGLPRCPFCGGKPIKVVLVEKTCLHCGYVGSWPPHTVICACGGTLS